MNDLLVIYILIGLLLTVLSLFSEKNTEMLAERSFPWRLLWAALVTTLWLPVFTITFITVLVKERKK